MTAESPPGDALPHAETPFAQQSRTALRGILALGIVAAAYLGRDFLLPLVLAIFVALSFRPSVRTLQKFGIPPWMAAVFFMAALVAGGGLAFYLLIGPVAAWFDDAPRLLQQFSEKFSGLRVALDTFADLTMKIQDASSTSAGQSAVQEVVVREPAWPAMLAFATGYPIQMMITLLATLVIAAYLLASGDLFYEKLVRVIPNFTDKKRALRIVYDIEDQVSDYILALIAINAVLGTLIGVAFHLLGMPSPYLWGLLTFFVNFIPYIGANSAAVLSGFMAIITFDSIGYALLVPAVFVGLSLIESELASPLVLGRRLQMNSVAILLSLAFWTWIWGVPGTILAVPLLVVLKVLCDHLEGLSGLGEFLSVRRAGTAIEADPGDT